MKGKFLSAFVFLAVTASVSVVSARPATPSQDEPDFTARVRAAFGETAQVKLDVRGSLVLTAPAASPLFKASADTTGLVPHIPGTDLKPAAEYILNRLAEVIPEFDRVSLLETRVEHSRFGSVSYSTLTLDGYPVIDVQLRLRSGDKGAVTRASSTLPARNGRIPISDEPAVVSLNQAAAMICEHAVQRFDGLACPGVAQRVWFMTADRTLVPAARMLLRSADMSSLKEAIVDMRNGRLVRFAEIARR